MKVEDMKLFMDALMKPEADESDADATEFRQEQRVPGGDDDENEEDGGHDQGEQEADLLSDESQIAGTTWAQLKKVAMDGKNEQQSWFVSLNNQEKKLLGALISAQNAQGDMN